MITIASLLIMATPAVLPTVDEEIIVIGKRLEGISVSVGRNEKGKYVCSTDRSSGNLNLDKRLCKTTVRCIRDGAQGEAVKACVDARKPKLLSKLRKEMMAARK
ncbi:MAG: hypothetical protein ABJF89_02775 [Parasphingorhabdus sp.]|uniref:hypothetical protein n=1 Tax=Parasphingorhabdus sp. TaxID=2709688 RepID=UPI0032632C77